MIICSVTSRDGLNASDLKDLEQQIDLAREALRPKTKLTWLQTCAGGVAHRPKAGAAWGADRLDFYAVTLTCIVERAI